MIEIPNTYYSNCNIETIESHSEIIAKYLVDKLISYTVYDQEKKHINTNLNFHCYDVFTKKVIQDLVEFEYMAYDQDEFSSKFQKFEENKMFFNQVYIGTNDWSQLEEPVIISFITESSKS